MSEPWPDDEMTYVMNLAKRYTPAQFKDAEVNRPELLAWADRYVAGERQNVLLNGGVGTGKTANARALEFEMVRRSCSVGLHAITEQHYLDAAFNNSEREVTQRAQGAKLLLLDDVGAVKVSDWSRSRVFDLIDHRWQHRLPTIITTNLTLKAFEAHVGERAVSRLGQDLLVVTLTGPDRRRR